MKFKEWRASAGLTQEAAAKALGVARSTVAMWESGAALPTASKLKAIAELYGCTLDYLLN